MTASASNNNPCTLETLQSVQEQLLQQLRTGRIILVDSSTVKQNLFVAHFLANSNARLWWIDCSQGIDTLDDFILAVLAEADVDASRVRSIQADSLPVMAKNLGALLDAAGGKERVGLIFDHWDALHSRDIQEFVLTWADYQTPSLYIVILAREFNLTTWTKLLERGIAHYLSHVPLEVIQQIGTRMLIQACAFSQGIVYVNGQQITEWGRKYSEDVQRLFWYIMEHSTFSLSDAGAALFPELPPQESSREVRGLLKRLNQIVTSNSHDSAQPLVRTAGRDVYTTNAAIVRCYDVQHFEQAWEYAQQGENRRAWLRKAADLHQAPYLYRNTEARIRVRRRALQQRYAAALERLVRESLHSDNPEELRRALGDAIRAIRAHPVREDLYRHAMILYERLGMPQDALALYDLLLRRVQAISPQTEAVYREIIRRTQG